MYVWVRQHHKHDSGCIVVKKYYYCKKLYQYNHTLNSCTDFASLSSFACPLRSHPSVQSGDGSGVHLPHLWAGWGETLCLHCGKETREPGKYSSFIKVLVWMCVCVHRTIFPPIFLLFFPFNWVKSMLWENNPFHLLVCWSVSRTVPL